MKISLEEAIIIQQRRADEAQYKLDLLLKKKESKDMSPVLVTNEDLFLKLVETEHSTVVTMARVILVNQAKELISKKEQVIEDHRHGIVNGYFIVYTCEKLLNIFTNKENG